jgi:hypothetical protein
VIIIYSQSSIYRTLENFYRQKYFYCILGTYILFHEGFLKKNPTQNLNCKPWVQYISFLGMYLHTHIDPKLFKVAPRSRILIFTFTNNIVVNLRAAVWRTHTYFGIGHRWKHINLSIFEVIISVTRWVYEKIAQNFAKTILCQNQSITLTL